jgi:MbtH protein
VDTFTVVVNDEEQYSVWPADRPLPAGWRDAGRTGSKQDCLAHIDEVWTDMRPASLRRQLDG